MRLLPTSSMITREWITNDQNNTKQRRKLTFVPFDLYVSADSCKMSHLQNIVFKVNKVIRYYENIIGVVGRNNNL